MGKRLKIGVLLGALLLLWSVGLATDYPLSIAGTRVTSDNVNSLSSISGVSGTVTYDPTTNTLTLDGAHVPKMVFDGASMDEATLVCLGKSSIGTVGEPAAMDLSTVSDAFLKGAGELTVEGGILCASYTTTITDGLDLTLHSEGYGLKGQNNGDKLIIRNANVRAEGKSEGSMATFAMGIMLDGVELRLPEGAKMGKKNWFIADASGAIEKRLVQIGRDDMRLDYQLWVCGVQVNSKNAADLSSIAGVSGTARYSSDDDGMLHLEGATLESETAPIVSRLSELKISIVGENTIRMTGVDAQSGALRLHGRTTFEGEDGKLRIDAPEAKMGIDALSEAYQRFWSGAEVSIAAKGIGIGSSNGKGGCIFAGGSLVVAAVEEECVAAKIDNRGISRVILPMRAEVVGDKILADGAKVKDGLTIGLRGTHALLPIWIAGRQLDYAEAEDLAANNPGVSGSLTYSREDNRLYGEDCTIECADAEALRLGATLPDQTFIEGTRITLKTTGDHTGLKVDGDGNIVYVQECKLKVEAPEAENGIYVANAELRLVRADISVVAKRRAIQGDASQGMLQIDGANVRAEARKSCIAGFERNLYITNCKIVNPSGAVKTDGKIVASNGQVAKGLVEIAAKRKYGIHIAGVQLTSENTGDIASLSSAITGTVEYDEMSHTLTLNNAHIDCASNVNAIKITTQTPLTIKLVGTNTMDGSNDCSSLYVRSATRVSITGDGKLRIGSSTRPETGVWLGESGSTLILDHTHVSVIGNDYAFHSSGRLEVINSYLYAYCNDKWYALREMYDIKLEGVVIDTPSDGYLNSRATSILNSSGEAKVDKVKLHPIVTHTVTFNTDGGSPIPERRVYDGEKIGPVDDPTRADHLFLYWHREGYSDKIDPETYTVKDDITLKAEWKHTPHAVHFVGNGGSPVPADVQLGEGDFIPKPDCPTKDGHVFLGWRKGSADGEAWDFYSDRVVEDVTLYARWEEYYGIQIVNVPLGPSTVDKINSSSSGTIEGTVSYDLASHTLTLEDVNIRHHSHAYTVADRCLPGNGAAIAIASPDDVTIVLKGKNVVQNAEPPHPLTYGLNLQSNVRIQGDGELKVGREAEKDFETAVHIASGATLRLEQAKLSIIGKDYAFKGDGQLDIHGGQLNAYAVDTYTCMRDLGGISLRDAKISTPKDGKVSADGRSIAKPDGSIDNIDRVIIIPDMTYVLRFDLAGGEWGNPAGYTLGVIPGGKIPSLAEPRRTGHRFDGWYVGSEKVDLETYRVNSDITLTAHWLSYDYQVTFYPIPGWGTYERSFFRGERLLLPEDMPRLRPLYHFAGWHRDSEDGPFVELGSEVHASFSVYGKWVKKPDLECHLFTHEMNNFSWETVVERFIPKGTLIQAPPDDGQIQPGRVKKWWVRIYDPDTEQYRDLIPVNFPFLLEAESYVFMYRFVNPTYTVSFSAEGGTPSPWPQELEAGAHVGRPNIHRAGYRLVRWEYTRADGSTGEWDFDGMVIDGPLQLRAVWAPQAPGEYLVSWSNHEEDDLLDAVYTAGEQIPSAPNARRHGWELEGWYVDGQLATFPYTVHGRTDFVAVWRPIMYTVTFEADGGTPAPPEQRVQEGKSVERPFHTRKDGYILKYWSKEGHSSSERYNFDRSVRDNLTLYAVWERVNTGAYVVQVLAEGQTYEWAVEKGDEFDLGRASRLLAEMFENRSFEGLYYEGQRLDGIIIPSEDMTLEARFSRPEYTISFDAKGGVPTPLPQQVEEGDSIQEPKHISRFGLVLEGWYYRDEWGRMIKYNFAVHTQGDLTLVAKWIALGSEQVLAQWDVQGGRPDIAQMILARGEMVDAPAAIPQKRGYQFAGWTVDGRAVSFPYVVEENTLFVATWVRKAKTGGNGGSGSKANGDPGTPVARASASPLRIAPNPAHDAIMLEGIQEATPLQIYSMAGQVVKSCTAEPGVRVDLGGLPAGFYLLRTAGEALRFVKE